MYRNVEGGVRLSVEWYRASSQVSAYQCIVPDALWLAEECTASQCYKTDDCAKLSGAMLFARESTTHYQGIVLRISHCRNQEERFARTLF